MTPLSTYYVWPLPKPGGLQQRQIQFGEFRPSVRWNAWPSISA